MYTQVDALYAGFWRRAAALAVDWILSGLICLPLSALFWALKLYGIGNNPVFFSYTGADLAHAAARAAYFFLLTAGMGATPGKRLLRMRVVSVTGAPLGWWDSIYRETVGRFLNGLLFLGYLFAAADSQKRTFADRLCDSRVIVLSVPKSRVFTPAPATGFGDAPSAPPPSFSPSGSGFSSPMSGPAPGAGYPPVEQRTPWEEDQNHPQNLG